MSWTDERVDTLKQLWHQGFTASQIAERLGSISRNAVIGKAHRLGLSGRPSPIKAGQREEGASEAPGDDQTAHGGIDGESDSGEAAEAGEGATHSQAAAESAASPEQVSATAETGNGAAPSGRGNGTAAPMDGRDGCAKGASILDLNDRICKWPIGDPRESDFRFCGAPAVPGLPYCAEHAAQAYQSMPRALEEEEETLRQQAAQRLRL